MDGRSPRDDWRKQAAGHVPRRPGAKKPPSGKRGKLIIAIVPLLIALGGGIGFLFWLRSEPAPLFLSLPVTETDGWPVNAWALQDGEGLKEHFRDTGKVVANSQDEGGFLAELDQIATETEKSKKRGAIVHLCAFAVPSTDGVLIVPGKAGPADRVRFIKLANILQKVAGFHGPRLLILDLRPVCDPRLGLRGHDLEPAIRAELKSAESSDRLPFLVALQCAPAEYPYVSPELRRGSFAEFLRRGLTGHADGWGPAGLVDGQITSTELMAYVRERVARWQKLHGAAPITPTLHGTGKDFTLKAIGRDRPDPEPVPGPPEYPEFLTAAWKEVAAWEQVDATPLARPASSYVPRTYQDLLISVRRAEDRYLGGSTPELVEKDLADRLGRLKRQRDEFKPKPMPVLTVGRASRIGLLNEKSLEQSLRPGIDALKKPEPKADEVKAKFGPLLDKPTDPPPYDAIVRALLNAIVDDKDLAPDRFKPFLETIQSLKPPPTQLEIKYLALLCGDGLEVKSELLRPFPRAVLAAILAAERGPPLSGRGLVASTRSLKEADDDLVKGMLAWFSGLTADAAVKTLADLRALPDRYKRAFDLGTDLARGHDEWQANVATLPHVLQLSPDDPSARALLVELINKCIITTRGLRTALDQASTADLSDAIDKASFARGNLRAELTRSVGDRSAVEQRARLNVPIWSLEQRASRRAESDAVALKLAQEGCAEGSDSPDVKASDPRREPQSSSFWEVESRRRADLYAALMGLAAQPGTADAVRQAYQAASNSAQREKLAWAIHPVDLPAIPASEGGARHDPGAQVRLESDREALKWLAGRYVEAAATWRALADKPASQRRADPTRLRDLAEALDTAASTLRDWSP